MRDPLSADPRERETIRLFELDEAILRRETTRARSGDAEIHLDIYPAETTSRGALVFVGGLSSHALMYAGFLDALSRRGIAVVALDLRGHGRSGGKRGDFTIATVLEDLETAASVAIERFGGPLAVMGSSLGGFFALAGANAIERFDAGISHWVMLPDMPLSARDRRLAPLSKALARVAPRFPISTRMLADWKQVAQDPAQRRRIMADPLMVWTYSARAIASGADYRPARPLTELRVPQLVIIGERDAMTPVDYTMRVFARLQGPKELAVVPGAGHMGGLAEHRPEVLDLVDHFLRTTLAPSSGGGS